MKDSQSNEKTCFNCGQIGFTCGECVHRSEWIPKPRIDEDEECNAATWECGGGEDIEQIREVIE